MMRAFLGAIAGCLLATHAVCAAERVSVHTKHYAVKGKTGAEIYRALQRRGPKFGLLSRAIAQTSYEVQWDVKVGVRDSTCRVVSATPRLTITYMYPKLADQVPAQTSRRWSRFMVGVKHHEEIHGKLARDMARSAEHAVRGLKIADDASCRKTRAEMKRRANKVYAEFEAKQLRFDAKEHRDGGNIDRLIGRLVAGG